MDTKPKRKYTKRKPVSERKKHPRPLRNAIEEAINHIKYTFTSIDVYEYIKKNYAEMGFNRRSISAILVQMTKENNNRIYIIQKTRIVGGGKYNNGRVPNIFSVK